MSSRVEPGRPPGGWVGEVVAQVMGHEEKAGVLSFVWKPSCIDRNVQV